MGLKWGESRAKRRDASADVPDAAASRAPGVRLMTHEISDLPKRQTMRLCLFDETDPIDGGTVVFAKATGGPTRSWEQALSFVVPQRVAGDAARRGQLANPQSAGCHVRATLFRWTSRMCSTAAITSPRQHAPLGLRTSHAHRPAAMCVRTRLTASDSPVRSIS